MKKFFKFVAVALILGFLGSSAFAQTEYEKYIPPYSFEEVLQKVGKNERLDYDRMWLFFLSHEDEERINAAAQTTEILAKAKQNYQQNKQDFTAVYNYAISLVSFGHGANRNKYLEEAIALFDEANALKNNDRYVYDVQSFALEERVLGYAYYKSSGWSDEKMISSWGKHPKFAAKQLAVYGRLFTFEAKTRSEKGIRGENIHHAYYIGCALGNPEALEYQKRFNTAQRRYNASLGTPQEDARWDEFCDVMDDVTPLGLKLAAEAAKEVYGEKQLEPVALKKDELVKSLKQVDLAKPAFLEKVAIDPALTGKKRS